MAAFVTLRDAAGKLELREFSRTEATAG